MTLSISKLLPLFFLVLQELLVLVAELFFFRHFLKHVENDQQSGGALF